VKLSKLRDLSGTQWDEDSCMIVLEEEHYNGHTVTSWSFRQPKIRAFKNFSFNYVKHVDSRSNPGLTH
jgi:hypothetical protein